MNSSDTARLAIDRGRTRGLALGVVGFIALVIVGLIDSHRSNAIGWQHFFQSYIFAYIFWFAIAMGSLSLLMIHHMTGGWWGNSLRRIFEASSRTIWFLAILFIPVLVVGTSPSQQVYPWTQPDRIPNDVLSHFKHVYLQRGFFTVRAVIYFAIWITIAYFLNKWSAEQDRTGDPILKERMTQLSAPGLVIYALTISGAVIDWVMSLEPDWFSTIYGMIFMVIGLLTGMAFSVVVLRRLFDYEPLKDSVEPKRFIDIGNLMLAFTILLTYTSFSQFLIIWSGNLKNEIPWYMVRAFGGWGFIAAMLLLFHFFIPFFLLLQRKIKRRLRTLAMVSAWFLVISLLDVYWIVVPAYEQSGPRFRFLDVFAVIGIGGLWVAAFYGQLKKLPLLPLHDPRFEGVKSVMERHHGD
jgi:hypothetical protein